MMRLAHPWFLLLILAIIPIILWRKKSGGRLRYSNLDLIKNVKIHLPKFHPRSILLLLRILTVIFFIIALCRPQSGKKFSEVSSEGVDILLALDTSGSMKALDFTENGQRVNRLHIVRKVVANFIEKRPNDRMGLVVFGQDAFTQCPLTLDHGILLEFLKKAEIGMAGDGTAIGQALGTAVKRLKDLKSKSKIVILLTDGRNNSGELPPLKASELAKVYGIKVYTIGVGTKGKAPFEMDTLFGRRLVYHKVDIDDKMLTMVANTSGGRYFRATDANELEEIYNEIDKLEKREVKVKEYTEYNELFHWFLLLGIICLLAEIFLSQTKLRKIP
ncbi:VWA domain-containing protein [Bacteriovoracaceae bacterium]|nr:VWA domain-containing protein [Bacteriovoracaceae bacterium]